MLIKKITTETLHSYFNYVLPHRILLFPQIQVGVVQENEFDCGFIVLHFIYAITLCYQEYPQVPLEKLQPQRTPFSNTAKPQP